MMKSAPLSDWSPRLVRRTAAGLCDSRAHLHERNVERAVKRAFERFFAARTRTVLVSPLSTTK